MLSGGRPSPPPESSSLYVPDRCPYPPCPSFRNPSPDFFIRWGFYLALCRPHPVPRFRCRRCLRTFSRQTARADYRLKKPHLNASLLASLVSSVSLRQTARILRISRHTVEDRLVRFGRHLFLARLNALRRWQPQGQFQFDEMESFEHHRILKPLTAGVLVEAGSGFLMDSAVGTLRSRAGKSEASRRRREEFEKRYGRRRSQSLEVVRRCLKRLRGARAGTVLWTDRKGTYATYARERLPEVVHIRVSGQLPKGPDHPLFWVNHTQAKTRDGMSRLRRRTWCTTKKQGNLGYHFAIYAGWHNYVRWRTNRTRRTPAMVLGVAGRRLRVEELFAWRQDWGRFSRRLGA